MALIAGRDEYNDIVRLVRPCYPQPGQTFINSSTASPTYSELCRHLTLARGRILYEVYDSYEEIVIGYMVPSYIARIAREYKNGVNLDCWNELEPDQTAGLKRAHAMLSTNFPRMPNIAAKEIAEHAERFRWKSDKVELEAMVVNHVTREWSSFDFRMEAFVATLPLPYSAAMADKLIGEESRKVFEIVKPRVREVLKSWLSREKSGRQLTEFYKKHKLCSDDGKVESYNTIVGDIEIRDYGGAETAANVGLRSTVFT